jgi:hypothetical protein
MKKFLAIGFLIFGITKSFAQVSNCPQTLRLASATYDQGRLHELEGLLEPCIKSGGFSQTELVSAYKFLALAYIYLEEPEKADATMLKILETDHYFEINEQVDPAEFKALYNTFRTSEIYRLGVRLGGNLTQPNLSSSNNVTTGSGKYSPGYGFSGSLACEIPLYKLSKRLTFAPEIQIQLSKYKSKTSSKDSATTFTTAMSQNLSYVSVPLLVQYEFGNKQLMNNKNRSIRPYLTGGVAPDFLFGSTRSIVETRTPQYSSVEQSDQTKSSMNKINISAVLGAGLRWRVAGGFFVAEVRYKYGFSNIPIASMTYSDQNEIWGPKYAPAAQKINAISLSVGYVQNFFNPKKLKPRK